MKIIPTSLHGAFDYICGFTLILSPHALGFATTQGPERLVPQLVGLFILLQSLVTRYECGVLRLLPMSTHRLNESLVALFLALSPWVFDFHSVAVEASFLHSVMGGTLLLSCLLTADKPRQVFQPAI
jgi:hypothetical protein